MCEEKNMLNQFSDIDAETVEQQLENMCDEQVLEISKELIKGKKLTEFEKFFKNLEFETISRLTQNEDFLQIFLKYKLLQGCWLDVIEILKTREHFSKPVFLHLWDEANYQKYQEEGNRKLTPLRRYRVRQKNPPPDSICPSGFRPSRLLPIKAVSLLQKWFNAHKDYPYPCKSTKARMARSAGITVKKVTTWFQNARRKYQRKLLQEAIVNSSTNLPFISQPLATKCSTLQPIIPRTTCDVSTQSETVIIISEAETCNDIETIDQQDCGFKPRHLNMDEKMPDITVEERQVDHNNNLAGDLKCTSICVTGDRNESEEASDGVEFVPTKTSQNQGQNMNNIPIIDRTDDISSHSYLGSEAQLKPSFDTRFRNKRSPPLGASLSKRLTDMQGQGMNFDWHGDQMRRSHFLKSAAQGDTGNATNITEDQCTQSNIINTNPLYRMYPDRQSVHAHDIVSNCQTSFSIDEQKCRDQWKDLTSALGVMTRQHNTVAQSSRHLDKGYSWQRANHSQTLSDLRKNYEWKNIADFKIMNEDFEWKNIDVCNTKTSKYETVVTNKSDFGFTENAFCSSVGYDNDINAQNWFGKPEHNKPSVINKCKIKPDSKFADISNDKKYGKMHPLLYRSSQGNCKRVKISHKMKHTLKTCIEKGKGQKSFLVCNKCNEVVKDAGVKSLFALQKLCGDIESNVQSPVEHVAKLCFEMDSDTEKLHGNKEAVPCIRLNTDLPLDMRFDCRPVDMTKDKEFNDSCINPGHFASRNQKALFEAEHSPMSLELPGFRDEIQPINMQDSYGRVVAEAVEGLLNMSSSQESN